MEVGKKTNKIRKLLAKYGREIARAHLVMGGMGNTSARVGKRVWIKRAGAWFEKATAEDFIAVNLESAKAKSGQLPSKEVFLHLGCYKARNDIRAVVHTHPVMTTALATAGFNLRRNCVLLRYYPPGSKKLARKVKDAIKKADAVMLAEHGLVTVGKNIQQAFERTLACEEEAKELLKEALFYLKKKV